MMDSRHTGSLSAPAPIAKAAAWVESMGRPGRRQGRQGRGTWLNRTGRGALTRQQGYPGWRPFWQGMGMGFMAGALAILVALVAGAVAMLVS